MRVEPPTQAQGAMAAGGGDPAVGWAPPPEDNEEGEQATGAEFLPPVLAGLPDEAKGATAAGGGNPDTAGQAPPPEQNVEGEQAGVETAGGGDSAAGWAPPPDTELVEESAKLGDVDLMEIVMRAWGATEDTGALGACTGTLRAKSGHFFKNDRTASRFSSLFADFGDYDDCTTPGGAQLDKLGPWPYLMTPVLDTG